MKKRRPVVSIGIVSLITVFSILILAVFTVLSLSGSRSDTALSETAARAVSDYYAAEAEEEQKLKELSAIAESDAEIPLEKRLEAAGFEIEKDNNYPGTVVIYNTSVDGRRMLVTKVGIGEQGVVERLYRQTISTGQ
ncbi:MAG: hypothetical protein GX222_01910 [Ruminococcaceae bacterium]|nr:hypothetical protein [Oscillospiraceae bacterium]